MALHFLHDFIGLALAYASRGTVIDESYSAIQASLDSTAVVALTFVGLIPFAIGLILMRKERPKTPADELMGK
jgi:hypothetical protein